MYWFLGKNGITCNNIHIKTVYIHMNWPYSYLKCCLKSHFLRLTINWNIYIYLLKNLKWYKCAWCHLTYSHQVNTCRWWRCWSQLHLMSYCVCPSCLTTISTLWVGIYIFMYWYIPVKAVLYIFFLSGINFFYLISGVFLFRCWYGEYEIQKLRHIYTQINSRQFFSISIKWKSPSKYHNIW